MSVVFLNNGKTDRRETSRKVEMAIAEQLKSTAKMIPFVKFMHEVIVRSICLP